MASFPVFYYRDVTTRDLIKAQVEADSQDEANEKLRRYFEEGDGDPPLDEDTYKEGEIVSSEFYGLR